MEKFLPVMYDISIKNLSKFCFTNFSCVEKLVLSVNQGFFVCCSPSFRMTQVRNNQKLYLYHSLREIETARIPVWSEWNKYNFSGIKYIRIACMWEQITVSFCKLVNNDGSIKFFCWFFNQFFHFISDLWWRSWLGLVQLYRSHSLYRLSGWTRAESRGQLDRLLWDLS